MSWLPSKYELWLHSEREKVIFGFVSKEHSLLKLVSSKTTFSSSTSSIVLETKERKKERKKTKIIMKQKKEEEDIYLELMK